MMMGASQDESSGVIDETDGVGGEDGALDAGFVSVLWLTRFLGEICRSVIPDKIGSVGDGLHSAPVGLHTENLNILPKRIIVSRSSGGGSVVTPDVAGPHSRVGGELHLYAGVIAHL